MSKLLAVILIATLAATPVFAADNSVGNLEHFLHGDTYDTGTITCDEVGLLAKLVVTLKEHRWASPINWLHGTYTKRTIPRGHEKELAISRDVVKKVYEADYYKEYGPEKAYTAFKFNCMAWTGHE